MNKGNCISFVVTFIIAITAPFLFTDCSNNNSQQIASNPNIIILFIDDLGYGDIEPFGSRMNKTPNLNILAEEGLRFTQFYLASVACSPSRSALLTGCYAERVSMNGRVCFPNEDKALNPDEFTLPEMLKEAGYVTGCFGKWHLGHRPGYLPLDHGFEVFHGIPYSNDMWSTYDSEKKQWKPHPKGHPPLPWIIGKEPVAIVKDGEDQSYLTRATTSAALEFIREYGDQYKEGGKPFLCYLPYAAVHLPRYGQRDFLPAGYDRDYSELKGKDYSHLEAYPDENKMHLKAQIEELDWAVGQFLKILKESGIERNTLILFLSDNGGSRYTDMGPLRGSKYQSAYEGGRRTAFIAWWPGTIPEGKTTNEIGITCDLMPTLARFCGGSLQDVKMDGMDLSGLFLDPEHTTSPHKTVPYGGRAFREGKWKVVGKDQLYDLERDPGESINLADQYPEKLEELVNKNKEWQRSIQIEARPCAKMQDPSPLVSESEADLMPKLSEYLNDSYIPEELIGVAGTEIYLKCLDDPDFQHHDPSNIIMYQDVYYMWYTEHPLETNGWEGSIRLVSSPDGYDWEDQGVAIPRGNKGDIDDLAAITSYVVPHNGKYYLFYTAFGSLDRNRKGITYAVADNPDGPWEKSGEKLLWPSGNTNEWDGLHIDDANILFFNDKWHFYYKGKPPVDGKPGHASKTRIGVAVSENLLGPFEKYEKNPVFPGHAFAAWVHREGVAAFGFGTFWSKDGLDFEKVGDFSVRSLGLYCPESFGDGKNYRGVSWGIFVKGSKDKARHMSRMELPLIIKNSER